VKAPFDHQCRANGCRERIPLGRLMCRTHWFALPRPLQRAINVTWRNVRRDREAYEDNVREAVRLLDAQGSAQQGSLL